MTIKANADGNWSSTSTWIGGVVPGNGDVADLNGHAVNLDIAVIPASGKLSKITNASGGGYLAFTTQADVTINGDLENAYDVSSTSEGIAIVDSGQSLTVNGQVRNTATDTESPVCAVCVVGSNPPSGGVLTVNNPTGIAVLNTASVAGLSPGSIGSVAALILAGSPGNAASATINGNVQNTGNYAAAINYVDCEITVNGDLINGDGIGMDPTVGTHGAAILFPGGDPSFHSKLIVNGNARNYANHGRIHFFPGTGGRFYLRITGNWSNYAPGDYDAALYGQKESLTIVEGDVSSVYNDPDGWAVRDGDSGGCVVMLGSLYGKFYATGSTWITKRHTFDLADIVYMDHAIWVCLGPPWLNPAWFITGGASGHFDFVIVLPEAVNVLDSEFSIDIRNPVGNSAGSDYSEPGGAVSLASILASQLTQQQVADALAACGLAPVATLTVSNTGSKTNFNVSGIAPFWTGPIIGLTGANTNAAGNIIANLPGSGSSRILTVSGLGTAPTAGDTFAAVNIATAASVASVATAATNAANFTGQFPASVLGNAPTGPTYNLSSTPPIGDMTPLPLVLQQYCSVNLTIPLASSASGHTVKFAVTSMVDRTTILWEVTGTVLSGGLSVSIVADDANTGILPPAGWYWYLVDVSSKLRIGEGPLTLEPGPLVT